MDMDDASKNKRQRDYDDLQNEMAGRETGRAHRFLPEEARTAEGARKRRKRLAAEAQLFLMLQDLAYRERYEAVSAALSTAMQATDAVLARLETQILAAQIDVDALTGRAARLPDRTRIYRDAQGVVRREDGSAVDDTLVATIIWTGNEPSFETFTAAQDHLAGLKADREDVTDYQNDVLGPAFDRITDKHDPPSLEELNAILDRVETRMPHAVSRELDREQSEAAAPSRTSAIALPPLKAD